MLDFSLPTDFGGVAADLDFSLSDVAIQSRDDGIENERYSRPKIKLSKATPKLKSVGRTVKRKTRRKTRRKSKQRFMMICPFRRINGRGEKAR